MFNQKSYLFNSHFLAKGKKETALAIFKNSHIPKQSDNYQKRKGHRQKKGRGKDCRNTDKC